jgi:acyl carrier protein
MKRHELERSLLGFVNGMRPEVDPPLAVDPETALFEDRVINSLRILDLIAFVEEATGSRIPDAAVRLENFRTVRAIVEAFGRDSEDARNEAISQAGRDHEPIRVFARRAGRIGFAQPVDSLLPRGELSLVSPGRAVFRGSPLGVLEFFDAVAREWAVDVGAREKAVPAHLPREILARAGCPMPHSTLGASRVPPAVCYHVYRDHQGMRLHSTPLLLTVRGRCARDEESLDLAGGRLRDFQMREIVALGSREDVETFRRGMIERACRLMTDLDLEGRIEIAGDPFFLQGAAEEARGRRLMQQVLPLKYELRLRLDEHGRLCAVASFNHHLNFFGRRFGIRLPSGSTAHTGCVAFGLERWTLAFLAQHGTDERGWPGPVREFCPQEVEG